MIQSSHSTCIQTGKRAFTSIRAARNAMRGLRARLRAYQCQWCRWWHLTKETDRRDRT